MKTANWRRAMLGVLALFCLSAPVQALAAAKVRIDYVRTATANFAAGATDATVKASFGSQVISGIGSTPVQSNSAPDFKSSDYTFNSGLARVTILSGAVNVAWGANPTANETNGVRGVAGQVLWVALETGWKISFVEAADGAGQTLALAASGVTPASTTLASATVWQPTFNYVAGRTFYLTLGGSGSGPVTVVYSRDNWATYAPEVAGVNGSAPIVMNKITYAGSPVTIPLSVSETGVKVGLLPGALTGTVTAGLTQ